MRYKEKFEESKMTTKTLANRIHELCAEKRNAIAKIEKQVAKMQREYDGIRCGEDYGTGILEGKLEKAKEILKLLKGEYI